MECDFENSLQGTEEELTSLCKEAQKDKQLLGTLRSVSLPLPLHAVICLTWVLTLLYSDLWGLEK